MYPLVIAVLATMLTAIVVSGGINRLNPDLFARREATELVSSGYRSYDAAFSAYRLANSGAMPLAPDFESDPAAASVAWKNAIQPYLPVDVRPPSGLAWAYGSKDGQRFLCAFSTPEASQGAITGLFKVQSSTLDPAKGSDGKAKLDDNGNPVTSLASCAGDDPYVGGSAAVRFVLP